MDSLPDNMKREHCLPFICWMVDSSEIGFVPGPCIAIDREATVSPDVIGEAFGVRFVFNLSEDVLKKHQDCVLDYFGDRFIFLKKTMMPFLNPGSNDYLA